jgi:cell volume regulation protein A
MLMGSDGIGGIAFDDFRVSYLLGTVALVVILFSGGLNTPFPTFRQAYREASILATVGVVIVAGLTSLCAYAVGIPTAESLLIGAIVSSTDAAAVFSAMPGIRLKRRVAATLELESGLNDPMAIILTIFMTANMMGEALPFSSMVLQFLLQISVGIVCGVGIGYGGRMVLRKMRPYTPALYPVMALGIAMLAYGVPTLLNGSGFLTVYLAAMIIGNDRIPHRDYVVEVVDSAAWFMQVVMFLMLGFLVFPAQLPGVFWQGLAIALFLAFVARPAAVFLCLSPFRYAWKEISFIAWAGLRGAVPIVIATIPVLSARRAESSLAAEALDVFDIVFFVVVIGSILPGATIRKFSRHVEEPMPSEFEHKTYWGIDPGK